MEVTLSLTASNRTLAKLAEYSHPESPKPSHDGFIWPVPRHLMRNSDLIRARMLADYKSLGVMEADNLIISDYDLIAIGWSRTQIIAHVKAVNDVFNALLNERKVA
jgi:hypothetical protein